MLFNLLAFTIIAISLFVAYRALRILLRNSWVAGWLRGMFGLLLLLLAVTIGLVAYDVFRYQQILLEQVIATISFKQTGEQQYEALLVSNNGEEQRYTLYGDQWQLDARVVKVKGYLSTFGIRPGYRLERIGGRYYDLEQEHTAKRSVYALNESLYGIDVWEWLNKYPRWVPVVDAVYGSATYLPMADAALYEISLSNSGLLTRPLNEPAERAINIWK